MSEKVKCAHCKHRLAKRICGCAESFRYNQQIDMLDSCDFFEQNPAQPLYSKALVKGALGELDEQTEAEKIEQLEVVIKLGLPEDDESYARFVLGRLYFKRAYRRSSGNADNPEFSQGIDQMEKAILMDSQGGYEIFSQPLHYAQLSSLAAAYSMVKDSIQQRKGNEAAIVYLEEKSHLFDYLSRPPLLLLLALGELYSDKGDTKLAHQTFIRILQVQVNSDDDDENTVRELAQHQLQTLDSKDTKRSGCFIATAVYESNNSREIETLKCFRDDFLMQKHLGKLFVSFYYTLAPCIAKIIEKSELAKNLVKSILLKPVLWFIQRTINKNDSKP